ncbi:hypothetical protein [Mycobacterium sp.]|nr:hypothetical protein [Mycobacterium sp.]
MPWRESIRLIDVIKGLSPEFVRGRIVKSLPALMPNGGTRR